MSTPPPGPLGLVGELARLLNAGRPAEATLAQVTDLLAGSLPAERVRLWRRRPGTESLSLVESPRDGATPGSVAGFEEVPPLPGATRHPLVSGGMQRGLLEVAGAPPGAAEILAVVADLLPPFLTTDELSEDLAFQVAVRAREVEAQRRFTSLIIDSLPVGLYVVDRAYRIQVWNRKRETGTQGLARGAVMGRQVFDVLTRQSPEMLREEFDQVFATGELRQLEIEVASEDGPRFYRLSKIPMRLDGEQISHVITIGEDVTQWHGAQQQILQSEKLAAIGQLAAGVMHEVNNPLATIGACVAALEPLVSALGTVRSGPLEEYLRIIESEVERCSGIVDGLLDFARPKGSAMAPVRLAEVVDETLFLLKHHKRFRQVATARQVEEDLPLVLGNREQLIQVLMALLLNGVDAVGQGGALSLRAGRSGHRADEVVLEVEDSGPGIAPAELSKIFEPFFTTKPQGRGTGLGLSICYGIVEAHRGRIDVDSQPGHGSTFRVVLPAMPVGGAA